MTDRLKVGAYAARNAMPQSSAATRTLAPNGAPRSGLGHGAPESGVWRRDERECRDAW